MRCSLAGLAPGLALLGGLACGCGGGASEEAQNDADTEAYCAVFQRLVVSEGDIAHSKRVFADLAAVGTPVDMTHDARRGFELAVDLARRAEDEAGATRLVEALSAEETRLFGSFLAWTVTTCTAISGLPGDLGSGFRSELPTELPSEFPSGFPTVLPSGLPPGFPSELLSELPSGFPSELPTELAPSE